MNYDIEQRTFWDIPPPIDEAMWPIPFEIHKMPMIPENEGAVMIKFTCVNPNP